MLSITALAITATLNNTYSRALLPRHILIPNLYYIRMILPILWWCSWWLSSKHWHTTAPECLHMLMLFDSLHSKSLIVCVDSLFELTDLGLTGGYRVSRINQGRVDLESLLEVSDCQMIVPFLLKDLTSKVVGFRLGVWGRYTLLIMLVLGSRLRLD